MKKHKIDIKPLSINEAFQGKRFKTPKYKSYENEMMRILPDIDDDFTGELYVSISYGFSSKLSDIDNPCKNFLDCLVKKYGFDDRQIFELCQEKKIVKKGFEYIEFKIGKLNE